MYIRMTGKYKSELKSIKKMKEPDYIIYLNLEYIIEDHPNNYDPMDFEISF